MDFRLSPEDQALRQEAIEFVRHEWDPKGYDSGALINWHTENEEAKALVKQFAKKLAAKGWYTMHWPVEVGGKAAPISTQVAYAEAMAYAGAPATLGGGLVGPVIIVHGQDWQKNYFLPRLANADLDMARGFSEPNAGSDLASLQTRAVREGDDYVLNGQKIWGTYRGEWMDILVRTDPTAPKHRGITHLLMQLKDDKGDYLPGIMVRTLYDQLSRHRWDELFLDNVHVPTRNILGEENRGWYTAMTALSFERTNIAEAANLIRLLEEFVEFCHEQKRTQGSGPLDSLVVRHQLANLRVELEALRMLCYRVGSMQARGLVPQRESSMTKLWGDTLSTNVYRFCSRALGDFGDLLPDNRYRVPARGFLNSRAVFSGHLSVAGGTTEVQKNIIAQRGLGLPR